MIPFHVHFGAGRLGLGLVVPLLLQRRQMRNDFRLVVMQRPNSHHWHVAQSSKALDVYINDEFLVYFVCVTDEFQGDLFSLLDDVNCPPLFISTSRIDILAPILSRTATFSTAVGVAGLDGVHEGISLVSVLTCRTLYAFENDVTAVRKLLHLLGKRINVIPVSCDRICIDRIISRNRIDVTCEKFPGAVVLSESEPSLFVSTPSITLTKTCADYEFYARRKFLLLNALHVVMSMWTYIDLAKQRVPPCEWSQEDVRNWRIERHRGRELSLLLAARVLQLLSETPPQVFKRVYGTSDHRRAYTATLGYARGVVKRILAQPDNAGRILAIANAPSVQSKLASRFLDLRDFIATNKFAQLCGDKRKQAQINAIIDGLFADFNEAQAVFHSASSRHTAIESQEHTTIA